MPQQIIKDRLVEALKTTASWPGAGPRAAIDDSAIAPQVSGRARSTPAYYKRSSRSGYTPVNGFRFTTRSR
jgi:hypothetical protein